MVKVNRINNLKLNISQALLGTGFSFNLNYLPRWAILILDILAVVSAGIVSYILLFGMNLLYVPQNYVLHSILVYLSVNIFFFWIFKTYSGIIRHSSYIDALKIFFAQFGTLFILILIDVLFCWYNDFKIFLTSGLIINGILSFFFLFFYRIVIKQTFERYGNVSNSIRRTKALILGSDGNAIAVANALRFENPRRFKLLGFIDPLNRNTSKRILDLPIMKMKHRIPVIMRSVGAEALIISDKTLNKEERLAVVEECLDYGYKVFTIPLVTDWENQKEISKNIKSFEIQDLLERKPIVLDMKSISSQLQRKTILVTGAAGSIGSEIVRQLLGFNPQHIVILDQAETPLHSLCLEIAALKHSIQIHNVIADIRNRDELKKIFKKYRPQVVYHAAAYKHVPLMEENPAQAVFTNVMGTKNVADLASKYDVERFVMVSTDKAVNPSNVMGASKRIAEKYVQALHLKSQKGTSAGKTKFITTRFGNVLGSNGSVVPLFKRQIQEGGPVTITHPDIIRYFMTIPEACQLVLEAGAMGKGGEIYIFDMGAPVKIIDLAKKMIKLAGYTPDKEVKIKVTGLRPGEKLYEELLNDSSKTLPTHHEKIMIAEELHCNFDIVKKAVEELINISEDTTTYEIVSRMKAIVPEFKSMNSVFEKLDEKS